VYDSVLDSAEVAESARTAEEEAQYQAARDVLRSGDHDSDKLVAYRRCRDAYLLAEQRYTAASLTAASAGPDDQRQWEQTTKPLLRRELAELMQAWMFEGFKEEIENAQTQVATLGARSPSTTWGDWRSHYNPDVDALSDAMDGTSVMPAGFSPSNAVAEGAWRSFTLSPPEVSALLQEAPPAWLTAMLGAAPPQATQSISFEFSSAAIVRPWFDPALFKARFWRFGQQDRMLSDGRSPPTGECPAYVAAVVFARRVLVTGAAAPAPAPFEGFGLLQAANLSRARVIKRAFTPLTDPTLEPGEIPPHLLMRRRHALADTSAFAAVAPASIGTLARRRQFMALDATTAGAMLVAAQPRPSPAPAAAHAAVNTRTLNQFARMKVDRAIENPTFVRASWAVDPVPAVVAPPHPAPAPVPTPAPAPAADPNTVYVLAFICKPLPQCPNPDPALQW
jgi:hypothetical protein